MSIFSRSGFSAKSYAAFRPSYPAALYSHILSFARSNGTPFQRTTLVDLGCGHGVAAVSLAPHFTQVIAVDPSASMIEQAQAQAEPSNITFHTAPAESLSFIPSSSVDLVVSAQAAHWFDYKRLWPELARIIKPNGTLAFWGYKDNVLVDYPEVNTIFDKFIYSDGEVAPGIRGLGSYWEQPGRSILRDLYRSIQPPESEWTDIQRSEHEPGAEGAVGTAPAWSLRKHLSLGAMDAYHRTFSSYKAWKDEHAKDGQTDSSSPDVFDTMWECALDAVPEWKQSSNWRGIDVDTDWGTCLLLARRR